MLVVVVKMRPLHPERTEDPRRGEFGEGHAAGRLRRLCEEGVAHVRVEVLRAGLEVEFALARHEAQDLLGRDDVVEAPSGDAEQLPLVPDPARVVDHLTHGDGMLELRDEIEVRLHGVVQGERPLGREHGHGHRGELLRDRGDMEHRVGRDGDAVFDLGVAVAARMDDLAVPDDGHGGARRSRPVEVGEHRVDSAREGGGGGWAFGAAARRDEQRENTQEGGEGSIAHVYLRRWPRDRGVPPASRSPRTGRGGGRPSPRRRAHASRSRGRTPAP